MLFRQMEYFQAVVEQKSFTAAAQRCNISQSAISQQIQALEAELGVQLLERLRRRAFTLTPAGELFYKRSLLITSDVERLRRDTVRTARAEGQTLHVGCLSSYSGGEFQTAIAAFSQLHPEVELHVTVGNHEDLFDGLRLGKLDLVLNDQRRAFSDAYVNLVLSESRAYAEIATFNPMSRLDSVELADLKQTPCIVVASESQRENEQSYYEHVIGFQGEFLFAGSLQAARVMVAANRGVMPVEVTGSESYPGPAIRRVALLRAGEPIRRNLCAFRKKENRNPFVEDFERMLAEYFK